MSIPILYESGTTDFWNMGLGPLSDTLEATVTEQRNGEFYLDLSYPIDGARANELKNNRIIVADAGHSLKAQQFDITDVQRGLTKLTVHAEHVSYRTSRYPLTPTFKYTGNADGAIRAWQKAIVVDNNITADSDISTTGTVNLTIDKAQNARQVLGGVEGSILDVYGGEYRFDNEHISLLNHRGSVVNTLLAYGRNITDFNQEEAIGETYTSIYPYALVTKPGEDEATLITLPEYYVDGDYVKNFPQRRVLPVDLSSKFCDKNPTTVDGLRTAAKAYVKANQVGVPKVSTTISFVDLSKTTDYADVAGLEEVNLCDEVPFWFSKYDIRTTAKVSSVVWNVLSDSYNSITLGDLAASLSESIQTIATQTASQEASKAIITVLQGADGLTNNFYSDGVSTSPTAKKIGDRWFAKNGDKTSLYIWDGVAWREVVSTDTTNKIAAEVDAKLVQLNADMSTANSNLQSAQQDIDDLQVKLKANDDTQAQLKIDLSDNTELINQVKTDTANSLEKVNNDLTQAKSDAASAVQKADDAVGNAQSAVNASGLATMTANAANDAATAAKELATSTSNSFAEVKSQASTAVSDASAALEAANGASSTATKASQDVDTIKGTIKTLATTETVNSIKGEVDKATTDIETIGGQMKQVYTKTETTNLLTPYATQTWAQNQITATATELNSTLTTVQTQVQNSAVGINLLRNARTLDGWKAWPGAAAGKGFSIEDTLVDSGQYRMAHCFNNADGQNSDGPYWPGEKLSLTAGQVYTISIWSHSLGTSEQPVSWRMWLNWDKDNTYQGVNITNTIAPDWTHYSATFTATVGGQVNNVRIIPYFEPGAAANVGGSIYLLKPKLERGSRATDFSVNPADNATVTALSKLSQTVDGLTGTFATKNDLATTESNFKVTADGLNLVTAVTGTKGENVTQVIADVKDIKTTMTGANGVTTRLQTLEGFQSTATSNITNLQTQQTTLAGQYTSLIESADNKVRKPWFDDGQVGTWSGGRVVVAGPDSNVQNKTGHSKYLKLFGRDSFEDGVGWFSVTPGEVYYFSGYMGSWGTTYAVNVGLNFVAEDGTLYWYTATGFPANSKTPMSAITGSLTVPAGVVRAKTWVQIDGPANTDLGFASICGLRVSKSATNSQITQLQNQIDLRTTVAGKVTAALNLSNDGGGTVTIQGASLYVTAASHFDNASIQSAAIANLDAAKITSGSISADRLATTKLNADNITSGSIAAERLAATKISATNIVGGTFDAGTMTVKHLSADMIATGTLDVSKLTAVKNFSASNIIGGTLDASTMTVKKLSASSITGGTLNAANASIINLNGASITAGTITADKLATNAILIGINNGLKKLRIDSNGLYLHGNSSDIGYISSSNPAIDTSLNGLAFNLSSTADYMSWAAQNRGDASGQYQGKLTWARADVANKLNIASGFTFDDDALFMGGMTVVGQGVFASATQFASPVMFASEIADTDNVRGRFGHVTVSGTNCFGLFDSTGKSGIAMSSRDLYFVRGGKAYSLANLHTLA